MLNVIVEVLSKYLSVEGFWRKISLPILTKWRLGVSKYFKNKKKVTNIKLDMKFKYKKICSLFQVHETSLIVMK